MAFNLSKNNDPIPASKKNIWVIVSLAVVMIGAAIWYFIPKKEVVPVETAAPAMPVSAPDTTATTTISTPAISPQVAASFNKGTSTPLFISDEVVDKIKQSHKITIYGYASSEGDLSVNMHLAQERAESFKQYLVSRGVDASLITAVGKGIENPVASNATETGRIQNRRVEVSIE